MSFSSNPQAGGFYDYGFQGDVQHSKHSVEGEQVPKASCAQAEKIACHYF